MSKGRANNFGYMAYRMERLDMARCMILDLDGTLVDSVPDLELSLNRLMAARGLAGFGYPAVAAMVGDGAAVLVERAFAAHGRTPDASALDDFLTDYGANTAGASVAYPGVEATLRQLFADGWKLAVCTNKPEVPARSLLAALGLNGLFAAIGGADSYPMRKPDPGHLLATLASAGGTVDRSVMIGDHKNDVAAALGAGVPCIFAAWGYGPHEMAAGAVAVAEDFPQAAHIAAGLLRA